MTLDFTPIQNFNVQGGPDYGVKNLPLLRDALKQQNLDGFLVPHEDEYQNEYLPDCNERLMWVSGFTGSAGAAIVMQNHAVIFVDGRYTIQVRAQVDPDLFAYDRLESPGITGWIKSNIKTGQRIGYDPKLHSAASLATIRTAVDCTGGKLISCAANPIDLAWQDRPAAPTTAVTVQPLKFAGEAHTHKCKRVGEALASSGCDAALITAPPSIAWLLNIRGHDVMCTPLTLSTAIIRADGHVDLYIDPRKVSDEVRSHLGNHVSLKSEDAIKDDMSEFSGQTISVDPSMASAWYFDALKSAGAKIKTQDDPVALPKACKNAAEIAGSIAAHHRDGVALVTFLHWLDTEAQSGEYDEIDAAQKLESLRHSTQKLKDLSFETISGAGSNGAIVHYRVSTATTQKLSKGSLFLIDSGGQYEDGTTDVTRTVPIGTPTDEMRERFTLVLKGHISLATIRFPEGTTGSNLDVLARAALWQKGLDYDHGTGHGVGVFLGVHEGPQRISKRPNSIALEPGMIVSNEPGYYKTGEYGIRIENLQYVVPATDIPGGERPMLGFQNLTYAPLHRDLIELDMLTRDERDYIDAYHAEIWEVIAPHVDGDVKDWLETACRPL